MEDHFPHDFVGFGAIDDHLCNEFIGFGAMDDPFPHDFIGFGAKDAQCPYEFIGFGAQSVDVLLRVCACVCVCHVCRALLFGLYLLLLLPWLLLVAVVIDAVCSCVSFAVTCCLHEQGYINV